MNHDQRTTQGLQPFLGQVAIVTGATGGVGRAVAAKLLEKGATVCLVGRTAASLEHLVNTMKWRPDRVHRYPVDLDRGADTGG